MSEHLFQAMGIQAALPRNPESSSLFPKASHAQTGEQQSPFSLLNEEVGENEHEPRVEEVLGTKTHHYSPQSNTLTIRRKAAYC